ncbi:MAG: patatin-like phospholipase family protein [Burkholderiales bacterium]|nr:patatin-like phospholipase family protein [Burkholderiales bacterium]
MADIPSLTPSSQPGRSKLGLALSGGGFRASLFHIGVLAQMADMGLLRSVEVISTVSGGSIIGALYYLHVKKLLETVPDKDIKHTHYQDIIARIEREFLSAAQKNLRMRIFSNLYSNVKMLRRNYSRSDRIAWLYDHYIYCPAYGIDRRIQMRELKILPCVGNTNRNMNFYPLVDNESRRAKVPIILINATVLNNGHNWRFEAARMGTPPLPQHENQINSNVRLERPDSYDNILTLQQDIELGSAVAASAAVPLIFPPLPISGMYQDLTVQLADGGVYDNQGTEALVDPQINCSHLVVSDASAQLDDQNVTRTRSLNILTRVNDITMERVRVEDLASLLSETNRKVAIMHLREGLEPTTKPYLRASENKFRPDHTGKGRTTEYGVAPELQDLISRVRTDLDAFSDAEAFTLMLDGYRMSTGKLQTVAYFSDDVERATPRDNWVFMELEKTHGWSMANPSREHLKHIRIAHKRFLKLFHWPIAIVALLIMALFFGVLWMVFGGFIRSALVWPPMITSILKFLATVVVGVPILIALYLATFNELFLRQGRIKRAANTQTSADACGRQSSR